jgi:seryl-tRNA(Sec) selenium transferase
MHDQISIVPAEGRAGSGAYPVHPIPSFALKINNNKFKANKLAQLLRAENTPVFGYITDDVFHINFLTISDDDVPSLAAILNKIL